MNAVEIRDLTIKIKDFEIDSLSLDIKRGCITGLVGKNGAGKTTLIRALTRQLSAQSGSILYDGKKFADHEVEILSEIACVFDAPHFPLGMKIKSLKSAFAALYPAFNGEMFEALCRKFSLPQNKRASSLSLGMQRKLCVVLALAQSPKILFLDEPTAGVDPSDRAEIMKLLQDFMLDEGHTVFFSTHVTEDLDKIADYIVIMDGGRIIFNEDKVAISSSYRIVDLPELTERVKKRALGVRRTAYGCSALVKSEEAYPDARIPTTEELFLYLTDGNGEGICGH